MEEVRGDLIVANEKLKHSEGQICNGDTGADEQPQRERRPHDEEVAALTKKNEDQKEYIDTLEAELEIVTEDLIKVETKLLRTQAELEEALAAATTESNVVDANQSERIVELEEKIRVLEEESLGLKDELRRVKEELELVTEGESFVDSVITVSMMNFICFEQCADAHYSTSNQTHRTRTFQRRTQSCRRRYSYCIRKIRRREKRTKE